MTGKTSSRALAAVALALSNGNISAAARQYGLATTTVRRAMRRQGIEPKTAGRPPGARDLKKRRPSNRRRPVTVTYVPIEV